MEFFDYKQACKELKALGIAPAGDTAPVRFELHESPHAPEVCTLIFSDADATDDVSDGAEVIKVEKSRLPQLAEDIIHTLHLDEVIVIPLTTWGAIINLVAFDIVEDEAWLEIDAEASLHQNGRDPLQLGPPDAHLLKTLAAALQKRGESVDADITVAATGAPLVMEIAHDGRLTVRCGHMGMRDTLMSVLD